MKTKRLSDHIPPDDEKTDRHAWLDKYVDAQAEQRDLLNRVATPYSAAELVELVEFADLNYSRIFLAE